MFNLMQVMSAFQRFKQNPMAMLAQRYNIPQNMSNPQDIIQHLLNSGQITQEQVNQAKQLQNDPMFRNLK